METLDTEEAIEERQVWRYSTSRVFSSVPFYQISSLLCMHAFEKEDIVCEVSV